MSSLVHEVSLNLDQSTQSTYINKKNETVSRFDEPCDGNRSAKA